MSEEVKALRGGLRDFIRANWKFLRDTRPEPRAGHDWEYGPRTIPFLVAPSFLFRFLPLYQQAIGGLRIFGRTWEISMSGDANGDCRPGLVLVGYRT